MFDGGSVDEILRRLGRRTATIHDKAKIIESIGKSSQAGAKAAQDFADGRISREAFEKIMDQLDGISDAQREFLKRGLLD